MAPSRQQNDRRLLAAALDWWDRDSNRLRIIRMVFWLVFVSSVAGTVYSAVEGTLPTWATSLYVTFAVSLVFATFTYAIRHSGEEEKRDFLLEVRHTKVAGWKIERELMADLARYAACASAGVSWQPPDPSPRRNAVWSRNRSTGAWPPVDAKGVVTSAVVAALEKSASGQYDHVSLHLDLAAYSSETFIELSRSIVGAIDDVVSAGRPADSVRVTVRVLTRDTDLESDWLTPLIIDSDRDSKYRNELAVRFDNVRRSCLGEFEDGLRDVLSQKQIDFQVRGYSLEPLVKGVLINDSTGIVGLYTIDELKSPNGWDFSGHAVPLFSMKSGGSPYEIIGYLYFKRWFSAVWDDRSLCRNVEYR